MRKLILAYEELSLEERAEADTYLQGEPELERELNRLRRLETLARETLKDSQSSADPDWNPDEGEMTPEATEQEAASRQRLLRRLRRSAEGATDRPECVPFRKQRSVARIAWRRWIPLAVAAAAVVVVLGPWRSTRNLPVPELTDLRVLAVDARGSAQRSAPKSFADGESFALTFSVSEDATVVVYHVDPRGEVGLAYPARSSDAPLRVRAGEVVQIPPPSDPEGWVFSGLGGTETFVVAVSAKETFDLTALDARIRRGLEAAQGRSIRIENLEDLLRIEIGPTMRVDATHRE